MNRRTFIKSALQAMVIGPVILSKIEATGAEKANVKGMNDTTPADAANPFLLTYDQPAQQWLEALPIGNGRLAAMVFGGVGQETLQLNEGSIWSGGPHDYDSPDALAALPEIRRLVFAEQWAQAEDLINKQFLGRPGNQSSYQPAGSLELGFPAAAQVSGYNRQLDLDTAIATTSYTADGVRYTREVFASFPDQVIVLHISADRPKSVFFSAAVKSAQSSKMSSEPPNILVLDGVSGEHNSDPGQVRFQARVLVRPEGGNAKADEGQIAVAGADAVTLLISIGTSYRRYDDVGGDAAKASRKPIEAASGKSYEELRRAHLADYQPRFRRVSIDLGSTQAVGRATDTRIQSFAQDKDPSLVALYCQFGRYLLLSCSRGGAPATLQGLWNDSVAPPWGSKYTININTEMNYWPAGPANLLECYEPLFEMLHDLAETGARTAKAQYGAGGWMCHHNTDGWRGAAPVDGAFWGMWPTGGAWLCKSIWDHYEFTGDKGALRRHYPLLKGAAQFFLETLVEEPTHKWLVTCPSVSPENAHHPNVSVCAGPTMDMEILRDLFDSCANAGETLGIDADFRRQVQAARDRLAPLQIGAEGQLQEWLEDWDAQAPEIHHRHVSHLYAVYPSEQITRRTPDLFAAARKSLEMRGDESTGWAMAWRVALWARLGDGDHSLRLLSLLLTPDRTAPNLFDLCPPFQIDGNFGAAAAVLEMLLQSHSDELYLLPALPANWRSGSVRGLRGRGGYEVGLVWADGALQTATIHALHRGGCTVRLGDQTAAFPTRPGRVYTLDSHLRVVGEAGSA